MPSYIEAAIWIIGIAVAGGTICSVAKSLSDAAAKIKGYDNDPRIFDRRNKDADQDDSEDH